MLYLDTSALVKTVLPERETLQFRDELTALVAYDRRITEAARWEGLRVLPPAAP